MTLRILWFDETDLSTLGAGQISKTLTLLNGLSKYYVDITLLCRCSSPQILQKNLRKVKVVSLKPDIRNSLLRFFPHDVIVYAMRYMRESFDLVIFSHIYESLPLLLSSKLRGLPVIYDCHGVELRLLQKGLISKLIVTTMESLSVRLSDTIIVLSEADREDVKQLYGVNDGVVVIPLGE
ncbi:MAG: glycosyltransferase family 4 protein [Crenarchaeota archaeon]|nr:glycosyltransferase family 4 protein [Thermoproteota archaeon]